MKKGMLALVALMCVASCSNAERRTAKVDSYEIAYLTSEVQEKTHDCYLAKCGGIYVEVAWGLEWDSIEIEKTGHIVRWNVYGLDEEVTNGGWEWRA